MPEGIAVCGATVDGVRGSAGVTPPRAATFVPSLLLLVWIAGFDPSPVHTDDATARMRIAAHDVHLAAYDNTLRQAITAVTSLARRTPRTVLAFRRLANHTASSRTPRSPGSMSCRSSSASSRTPTSLSKPQIPRPPRASA